MKRSDSALDVNDLESSEAQDFAQFTSQASAAPALTERQQDVLGQFDKLNNMMTFGKYGGEEEKDHY